jgi:demethylmenaquinone methyltransferase/2-methoxy-6-polyprenyl-1,4-benzoquinol methylase
MDKSPARIAGMLDDIAGRYDTLNHLLSAGLDYGWRRRAVSELGLTGCERALDMCTGTADLAIALATARPHAAREVVGVDFSWAMLRIGARKVERAQLGGRVRLARGDAMRMPLPDASCDAATIAFGIRNVVDAGAVAREFCRVLRARGRLAVLEFGTPTTPGFRAIYQWYFRHVLPRLGGLVSRHRDAYVYLPASVAEFPSPETFSAVLRDAGFHAVRHIPLTFGAVSLFIAEK